MISLDRVTQFQWDPGNAGKSLAKHRVTEAEAEQVFFNEPLLLLDDIKHSQAETRYHALGRTDGGRRLHITFTLRRDGTHLRVISARDVHRKERETYGQED